MKKCTKFAGDDPARISAAVRRPLQHHLVGLVLLRCCLRRRHGVRAVPAGSPAVVRGVVGVCALLQSAVPKHVAALVPAEHAAARRERVQPRQPRLAAHDAVRHSVALLQAVHPGGPKIHQARGARPLHVAADARLLRSGPNAAHPALPLLADGLAQGVFRFKQGSNNLYASKVIPDKNIFIGKCQNSYS